MGFESLASVAQEPCVGHPGKFADLNLSLKTLRFQEMSFISFAKSFTTLICPISSGGTAPCRITHMMLFIFKKVHFKRGKQYFESLGHCLCDTAAWVHQTVDHEQRVDWTK